MRGEPSAVHGGEWQGPPQGLSPATMWRPTVHAEPPDMQHLDPPATSAAAALPQQPAQWQMRLLGGLRAQRGPLVLTRFGSRSVAALLARLALFPERTHAREELIELLWPGVGLEVGRNRLRQALFTLRQLLEPPGPVPAPVLLADRTGIRVVPGALAVDALLFERSMREGRFEEALRHYGGELLPGFYDDLDRPGTAAPGRPARARGAGLPAARAAALAPPAPPAPSRRPRPPQLPRCPAMDAARCPPT